ncbi:MAG: phosphoribosylglycinamide formyltransferase [Planctomycetes bacterium]|nr:phosphoribosylglycinamide formyltransferase [Planctomycetota bacterium]
MTKSPLSIAVLISGGGTTLQNFIDLRDSGELHVEFKLVISSRSSAKGLQRAAEAGIPTMVIERSANPDGLFSKQITDALRQADVDLVCMGGFLSMWIIPPEFEDRVMNIHPALLPGFGGKGFYGRRVHEAVLEAGCKVTGCTVHFVDNVYDNGPIILQRAVTVHEDDTPETLAKRIRKYEKVIYPEAIRLFAQNRLCVEGRRVRILESGN